MNTYEAIVIGMAAGGMRALATILPHLPEDFSFPVMVVQHIAPDSDGFLAVHLNNLSRVRVKEAFDKEPIRPATVYLAPPNYHLLVERDRTLCLSVDERVHFARPSIDVLFQNAADVYAERLVGVVLTGANTDGSQGLKHIRHNGGLTIVQDPSTAESPCMPSAAIEAAKPDYIAGLAGIGPLLTSLGVHGASSRHPAFV